MWIATRQRFGKFHAELNVRQEDIDDAMGKAFRVGQALERAYNGQSSDNPPVFPVGSWGKGTQVRPSADIDIMARFDQATFARFQAYTFNGQSAFLQEIKEKLEQTYSQTRRRGDGQVVQIDFNSIMVEVVPVLPLTNGQFLMPDTNGGGSWKTVDPAAQIKHLDDLDKACNGNVRTLCKIIKRWKHEHSVDLKSFLIELLVAEFLRTYQYAALDYWWFDWFVRDCLRFMRSCINRQVIVPGTWETVDLGDRWAGKLHTAIGIAKTACDYEYEDKVVEAGLEWQKIFGPRIPIYVL